VHIQLAIEFHHTTKPDAETREGKTPIIKKNLTETPEYSIIEHPNNWLQKSTTVK
jgi:hypothetical protein